MASQSFNPRAEVPHGLRYSDINPDTYYTVWECINGYWVVERSFQGSFLRIEDVWLSIIKTHDTDRPSAVFQRNFDPNPARRKSSNKRRKGQGWAPTQS
jgi:hypothetical protein